MKEDMQTKGAGDFGTYLVGEKLISQAQLDSALAYTRQARVPLERAVVELEMLGSEQTTRARAAFLDIPYVCLRDVHVDRSTLTMVDAAEAKRWLFLPIGRKSDGTLRMVVTDWTSEIKEAAASVAYAHNIRIAPALATEDHVRAAIEECYEPRVAVGASIGAPASLEARKAPDLRNGSDPRGIPDARSMPEIRNAADNNNPMRPGMPPSRAPQQPPGRTGVPALVPPGQGGAPSQWTPPAAAGPPAKRPSDMLAGSLGSGAARGNLPNVTPDGLDDSQVDQPIVIQFVNRILADAISRGASDIHLEPRRDRLDIRYRIDGTLHSVDTIRREFQSACTSRVKVMADMNIAERRLPQDGRIAVTIEGRSVDMRVSSLPTQYGESIVLRILDKGATRPSLDQLGFSERNYKMMSSLIRKPHGIFLATGPTGSGKTTTLYAAIQAIHSPEVNIITVEDPIEYDLEGIRQSNVHEKAGLTMARQLRAILRQDPDIIYVGEIRDAETAEIAFRAALTGHLVFSTLHCNDAAGAVTRLLNMDVDPFLVASSVVGVLAQRLVRRVCSACAHPFTPAETEIRAFGLDPGSQEVARAKFLIGAGCEHCDFTGYRGRYSVQELMTMDDHIRNMVLQRTPSNKIRKAAIAHGMSSMREDAASKVIQGITTFEEAAKRVFIESNDDEPAHVY